MCFETITAKSKTTNEFNTNYSELRVYKVKGKYQVLPFIGKLTDDYFNLDLAPLSIIENKIGEDKHFLKEFVSDIGEKIYIVCDDKEDLLKILINILKILNNGGSEYEYIKYEGVQMFISFDELKNEYPDIIRK